MVRSRSSPTPDLGGDPTEFEAFFRKHSENLLGYFVRRVLDHDVALELAAETFARAFEKRGRYRGRTPEEAAGWLYAIARTEHLQWARRGSVERRAITRIGLIVPTLTDLDVTRIHEIADLEETRGEVRNAITTLPDGQREAVSLRVVDELSYSEVAEQLGISEQTARQRVSRGLAALSGHLSPQLSPGAH